MAVQEYDFEDAVKLLFQSDAVPNQVTFSIFSPDDGVTSDEIYHQVLIRGARQLYNKTSLVDLTGAEIDNLNRYMAAIGVQANFEKAESERNVVLYDSDDDLYISRAVSKYPLPIHTVKYTTYSN